MQCQQKRISGSTAPRSGAGEWCCARERALACGKTPRSTPHACREVADDRFLHIGGGLQFTYDVQGQPYRFNRTSGELLSAGTRVSGVTYDCGELPTGTVRVVLNSQLAEGVQDYVGLKNGETLLTFGPLLSEALSMYLDAAAPQDGQVRPRGASCMPPCACMHAFSASTRACCLLWGVSGVRTARGCSCARGLSWTEWL